MLLHGYGLHLDTSRVTQIVTKDVSWIVIIYKKYRGKADQPS
jgi:hypothetical protein